MNIIQTQRENVITENNTAQKYLIDILNKLPRRVNIIELNEPLHGDLDFSVLRETGFVFIETIEIAEGEVTSIVNIPLTVKTLKCPKNLLVSLDNLPGSLTHLEIPDNYLTSFDFKPFNELTYINVSHNQLENISNFPEAVVEIHCQQNNLKSLDLRGLNELKVLNVSNNNITIIDNMPENVTNFNIDNNPSIEFRNSEAIPSLEPNPKEEEAKQSINYLEALNDYFELKQQYETKLKKAIKEKYKSAPNKKEGRKLAQAVKGKCIGCKRAVGTIFSVKDHRYLAICGDPTTPCPLQIEIYNGQYHDFNELIYIFKEATEEIKENIIRQKLDTLFSYIDEKTSIELFKRELEEYTVTSTVYKTYLDKYEEYHNSPHKLEMIHKKKALIFRYIENIDSLLKEYEKTENREVLKTAIQLQIDNLIPETKNLRLLMYELIELNKRPGLFGILDPTLFVFKKNVSLQKLTYNQGEPERVIKFKMT
jgi:hypothetical protein